MAVSIPDSPDPSRSSFHQIVGSFLSTQGLPFDSVLPAERIREVFAKHDGLFAMHGIYNTVVVLWAFALACAYLTIAGVNWLWRHRDLLQNRWYAMLAGGALVIISSWNASEFERVAPLVLR